MTLTEETGFVQQLALLNHEIINHLNKTLNFPHINANNYFYLLKLLDNPGITQSDFSTLVKLNQSTITRAINSLAEHGYVEKQPAADKRSSFLKLTSLGEQTASKVKKIIENLNDQLLLSESLSTLNHAFSNIQETLQKLQDKNG